MKSFLFIFLFCSLFLKSSCQFSNYAFGKVTAEELTMKECSFEPSAPALILGEKCEVTIDLGATYHNVRTWRRVKVFSSDALAYGNIELEFLHNLSEISFFSASVFNLEGGKIVEEKIRSEAAVITKVDKYTSKYIVVLPNVKVGSVIDIFYLQKNNNSIPLQPWYFQSEIPCGWSEYKTRIQKRTIYSFYFTDYLPFAINSIKNLSTDPEKKGGYMINQFAVENVPSVKLNENFVLRPEDQISKVEAVYSAFNPNSIWGNSQGPILWSDINNNLLNHRYLGKVVKKGRFLGSDLRKQLANSSNFEDSLQKVYEFIRQNVKCNGYRSIYSGNPKITFTTKTGNTGEINLLLLAALRESGFDCHPLLLSTNENPPPSKEDPRRNGVNYLVAAVFKDTTYYLLDASQRALPFNSLSLSCLNGDGFLVSDHFHRQWLPLLREECFKSNTVISYAWHPDRKDTVLVEKKSFSLSANRLRNLISESNEDEYKKYRKEFYHDYDISSPVYSGLDKTNEPFIENFSFLASFSDSVPGKSYYLPCFPIDTYRENPFPGIKRDFDIDFQAPNYQKHEINIKIPNGYTITSVPETTMLSACGNNLVFNFSVTTSADQKEISIKSEIQIKKDHFPKNIYPELRAFFAEIVKAQQSQIALKKD